MASGDAEYSALLMAHLGVPLTPDEALNSNAPASLVAGSAVAGSGTRLLDDDCRESKGTSIPRRSASKIPCPKGPSSLSSVHRIQPTGLALAKASYLGSTLPKTSLRTRTQELPEPAELDCSLDEDCPSPVLVGQINHRFEARSSDERQFSPVIPALKQNQEPQKCKPGTVMWDRVSSPVLQVVDANLPPVQTRIPLRNSLRSSKGSGNGSNDVESSLNASTGIKFNPRDSSESVTPTAFQAQNAQGVSGTDTALNANDVSGIQLLTPVVGCPDLTEGPDRGVAKEEPSRQAMTQAALHPLFQQASAVQDHVPVFHIPSMQDGDMLAKARDVNAVDQFQSPHVKMMKPSLFVDKQEPLSNPMPAHDPRNLLQNSSLCDQPIGTPPYAKLMRHLHGHNELPLNGEPTLLVKQKSADSEGSPAVARDAQPSLSEGTPDGRNFGDLLSAINAHQYHSPAPAMAAHLADLQIEAHDFTNQVEGSSPSNKSENLSEGPQGTDCISDCGHECVPAFDCQSNSEQAEVHAVSNGSTAFKADEPLGVSVTDDTAASSTSPEAAVVVESSFQTAAGVSAAEEHSRTSLFLTPEGWIDSPDTFADCNTSMSSQTQAADAVHDVPLNRACTDPEATPSANAVSAVVQLSFHIEEGCSTDGTARIFAECHESQPHPSSSPESPQMVAVALTCKDDGPSSSRTPDSPGFVDLLSAINAHQYFSPAPGMMAQATEAESAVAESSVHTQSPSLCCENHDESLKTDTSLSMDCTEAVSSKVQDQEPGRIPDMFCMGSMESEAAQPPELHLTQQAGPVTTSYPEAVAAEQSSFHTAGSSALNVKETQAAFCITPERFSESLDDFKACRTHMSSDAHETVDACERVLVELAPKGAISTASDGEVKLSIHIRHHPLSEVTTADSPASSIHGRSPCQTSMPSADLTFAASPPNVATPDGFRVHEETNMSAASWSFLQHEDNSGSGGLAKHMLQSPALLVDDSVAGFSLMLSPPSGGRESVASVCFNDPQTHSPMFHFSDQQSHCESVGIPGDQDKVNMLSPTKTQSPVKLLDVEPAVTPAHLSQERPILSPVLAHVEALKTLSKKKDSLRHSHQMGENAEDSAIQLPSDLDTPQCSRMVRELENALREGECDGLSGQGSYSQWISETGIIGLLTPTGQKDAALKSVFQKAQISDEALEAAEHMSKMEMEHNAQHNLECAELQSEQMKLAQENESLRQEKVQAEQDNACLRQEKVEMQQHNASLLREKMQLEARLRDALQKHQLQQATPTMQHKAQSSTLNANSTVANSSVLVPENSDTEILALIEDVKELEKHVVIVCQRSQQQDASGGSFEKTMSYLQQLDKKLHSGKVSRTSLVTASLSRLKDRIKWAQESLPELIGEFDRSMNKVSRRSMELASMKQLSRAVLDQEQSAVGELEEHLKYVGVSMRTHLHSIFVEVNRWPALIQKLLVHKGTKDEMEDQQADSSAQNDSLPAPFVPADENDVPLSKQLLTAADRVVNIMDSISIDYQKLAMPQKCPSPCLGTPVVAVGAGTSPNVTMQAESPSLAMPTGMTVSDLTPPQQVYASVAQENHRLNALNLLDNPLFTDEDIQASFSSQAEQPRDHTPMARASSMPASFAPSQVTEGRKDDSTELHSSGLSAEGADVTQAPVLQCSVSVQTSPPLLGEDASDTSPESCKGGCVPSTRRRDVHSHERVQFLCNALQVKVSPFIPRARRGGERHSK